MGKFETISFEGVKDYTVFERSSFRKILMVDKELPEYHFSAAGRELYREVFLDSPNALLASAGIVLSKVIDGDRAYFKVEREEYLPDKKIFLTKDKKVFIHAIGARDTVGDHVLFLIDGITSMFSTKFYIDLENVLKTVVPIIEVQSKRNFFKVLSGRGFKAKIIFDEMSFKNNGTRRKGELYMMRITQTSTKMLLTDFEDFTSKMEKYCKEIIPTQETVYSMVKKMTASIGIAQKKK